MTCIASTRWASDVRTTPDSPRSALNEAFFTRSAPRFVRLIPVLARSFHVHVRLALTVSLEAKPFIELLGAVDLEHLKPHRKIVSPALRQNHVHKVGTYAASLMLGQQGDASQEKMISLDSELEHASIHAIDANYEPVARREVLGEVVQLERLIPAPGRLNGGPQGSSMHLPDERPIVTRRSS
jgi:hypothetical protein